MRRLYAASLGLRIAAAAQASCAIVLAGCLTPNVAAGQVAPTAKSFRAEYLAELSVTADHVVRLAETIPADKYTWRPAAGVRSISEVLLHIASSHFNTPVILGVAPGETLKPAAYERSTTDKAAIVSALRSAFAATRRAVEQLSDADGEKTLAWFDGSNTYRGVLYFAARHSGEHTGQLIAYARVIGVVPPWSQR